MSPRRACNASQSIALPPAWVEEVAFGHGAGKFPPLACTFPDRTPLALSYEPGLLAGLDLTLAALQLELAGAVWLEKTGTKRADTYLLRTAGCTLEIALRTGRHQALLMQIIAAKEEENAVVAEQGVRAVFTLREVSKNASADLHELWRFFADKREKWHEQHKQWQAKRTTAARQELTRLDPSNEANALATLHLAVDRRYGQLESMLELFNQRVRVDKAAEATGILEVSPDARTAGNEALLFCLQISEKKGEFNPGDYVAFPDFAVRKRSPPKTILREIRANRFFFERAQALEKLAPGKKIRLQLAPREPWRKHIQALQRFRSQGTASDWEPLARLLTAPGELRTNFRRPWPKHWFAEHRSGTRLNAEQKDAVAGAMATPHAFFIHGPPGTGKTTVIVELVQQLAHAGERLLLLAPTHVAVDAVLERVGNEPGIRPLRLTWDEGRVDESALPFTYNRIKQNLIDGLRTPHGSRASRWQAAAERLRAELPAARERAATLTARLAAGLAAARARGERWAFHVQMRTRTAELAAAAARAADELATADKRLAEDHRHEAAAQQAAAGQGVASIFGKISAALPFGKQAARRSQWQEARRAAAASEAARDQAAADLDRATDAQRQFAAGAEETLAALAEKAVSARKEFAAAAAAWAALKLPRKTRPNRRQEEFYRTEAERQEGKLIRMETYPEMEARWFELTHPLGEDADTIASRLAEQIGHELVAITNLFCSTTTGLAGDPIIKDLEKNRGLHFDTLILDEASRVTDADFLIGAVRTRRWILVGDEKQLPPHAETGDEHFLHALAAIHRAGIQKTLTIEQFDARPPAADAPPAFWDRLPGEEQLALENAVEELAKLWQEENAEYLFRHREVAALAAKLIVEGSWIRHYREKFTRQQNWLERGYTDANRTLLTDMDDFLVNSVFARCGKDIPRALGQKLVCQRRMIEPLARIIADPIYQGDYRTPSEAELARCGVTKLRTRTFGTPVTFMNTALSGDRACDKPDGTGFIARLEAEWIVGACVNYDRDLAASHVPVLTVSILCFYRAQAGLICELLAKRHAKEPFKVLKFEVVDAIDKIQGQESDLVMLSFGRVRWTGHHQHFGRWLQDLRRLNVACSRAHRAMVFVGHRPTLMSLRSTPRAKAFYAHFFELFKQHPDDMAVVENYRPPEMEGPHP